GQVEIAVEKHSYDVAWFNPITGEFIKQKKDFKGEKFLGEPPDKTHDWVLRLSREGKKESMLKSFRFEAKRVELQEVEQSSQKVPFEVIEASGDAVALSKAAPYTAEVKSGAPPTPSTMGLFTRGSASARRGLRG